MTVAGLGKSDLACRMQKGCFAMQVGPFALALQSTLPRVVSSVASLYRDYTVLEPGDRCDFYIEMKPPSVLRRYLRPQVIFAQDGFFPFQPLPANQAFAMFEWGLNWCVANVAHQYLIIHSAVVAKDNLALILPGAPGSGKSTLCAALINRGWRLLSDEMTLLSLDDGKVTPVPRPVALKNESIDIIGRYAPDAFITEGVSDTAKGTVAHMRPPQDSLRDAAIPAIPAVVVFPKFRRESETLLTPVSRGRAMIELARNGFNYHILGERGFHALATMIDACDSYQLEYESLDEALPALAQLMEAAGAR